MKNLLFYVWTAVIYLLIAPGTAHAYIDPGAGSMLLQAIGALFIAASAALAMFKDRIFAFFGKGKNTDEAEFEDKEDLEK